MLTDEDRAKIWRGLMRLWSSQWQRCTLSKAELRATVDATDVWIDEHQASYNAALPEAAQSGLTLMQKTVVFCAVALARVGISWLRRVFGEVN